MLLREESMPSELGFGFPRLGGIGGGGNNSQASLESNAENKASVDDALQTNYMKYQLDHPGFLSLVGLRDDFDRLELYRSLRASLSRTAAAFWDGRPSDLVFGLIHSGRLEGYIGGFARDHLPELWAPDLLARLRSAPDLESQAALFVSEGLTDDFCRKFSWYFGRDMMEKHGRDPAQFVHVADGDVGAYFLERFTWACTHTRLADNFYVEFFLSGDYENLEQGPEYLRPTKYDRLKGLVDRVQVITGELEQLPAGSYS